MSARNEAQSWGTYNLVYKQGTDKTYALRYKIAGVPLDLTGYSATFSIYVVGRQAMTRTVGNGITIDTGTDTIQVTVSKSFAEAIPVGRHSYYLELVSGTGEEIPVLDGSFTKVA